MPCTKYLGKGVRKGMKTTAKGGLVQRVRIFIIHVISALFSCGSTFFVDFISFLPKITPGNGQKMHIIILTRFFSNKCKPFRCQIKTKCSFINPTCPLVRLSACPPVRLSACPLVRLSACPLVRLSAPSSINFPTFASCFNSNWHVHQRLSYYQIIRHTKGPR